MNRDTSLPRVGIVIPTLGTRPEYLKLAVESIRNASSSAVYILLVAPATWSAPDSLEVDEVVTDPGQGLAVAINFGFEMLPESIDFVNWLGDDDLLESGAIDLTVKALDGSSASYVFGRCKYIDNQGRLLFLNRSGWWAVLLMRFGPQLVPQPGSMFRRTMFKSCGGLDTQYKWAFDLDLFIRLSRISRPIFLPRTVASFRWHDDSLSVGGRRGSVDEASEIRTINLPRVLRPLSLLWEPLMRQLILRVGQRIKTSTES